MKYVAYYRVSTLKQEQSGLGLEAQRKAVQDYIKRNGNQIIHEFTETESGKKDKRPQLTEAIELCKQETAILVIAKLDRLSRNLTFISQLMDSKAKFVCCDMPEANELTIGLMAVLAQWERKRISERTKEAMAVRKAKGLPSGTNNFTDEGRRKGWNTIQSNARRDQATRHAWHFIRPLIDEGIPLQQIANMLNSEGYRTRTGKLFYAQQVKNINKRFKMWTL